MYADIIAVFSFVLALLHIIRMINNDDWDIKMQCAFRIAVLNLIIYLTVNP